MNPALALAGEGEWLSSFNQGTFMIGRYHSRLSAFILRPGHLYQLESASPNVLQNQSKCFGKDKS
jgi:hypothetical protein